LFFSGLVGLIFVTGFYRFTVKIQLGEW